MRARIARISAVILAAGARLAVAVPALADMPNPVQYPQAAERYQQGFDRVIWGIIGCSGLTVLAMIIGAVLLIRWIIRRKAASPATSVPPAPPAPPTMP